MTIRAYLIWLILATTVPLVLLAAGGVAFFAQQQRASVEREMRDTAHSLTVTLDRELQTSIAALQGLASSDQLDSGDLRRFYHQAARVLRSRPTWNTIILVEPSGRQLLNLFRPFDEPLPPRGNVTAFREAIATTRPSVSNLFTGAVTKQSVVSVELPVLRDGAVKYVLVGSIRLEALGEILTSVRFSPTWTAVIVDGNKNIVARSAEADRFVGKPASSFLWLPNQSSVEGWLEARAEDGAPQQGAFSRSTMSSWYVVVSAPTAALDAPLRRSLSLVAIVAAVIVAVACALAIGLGRRIARPVTNLAAVATALERQHVVPSLATPIAEVNRAGESIRKAASLLLERQENLRIVVESMSAPVTRCSRDLRYIWVSRPYADWLGRPVADVVGRPIVEVIGADAFAGIRPYVERVLAGERVEYEERIEFHGPGSRWIHAVYTPTIGSDGIPDGWVAVVTDVDERRRLENDQGRLASIVDSSDDAIVSKTLDGVITSWNQGAERMFGWVAEEAVGKHIALIVPEDRLAEEEMVLARLRAGERIDHFETVRVRKDGQLLNVSLTVSPLRDTSGRIIGASKIVRDVTERRRLEEARERLLGLERQAREAAETSNRAKDQFLAVVSHELRTPLNSMLGYARMLQREELDAGAGRHALDVIVRNALAQAQLVDDLLDLSRITTGRMRLTFEQCDLIAVLEDALDSVRPAADAKGLSLVSDVDPEVGPLLCAPDRIRQVVWNLVMNSIKFTPTGGHVHVRVRRAPRHAEITVADNGVGISPEVLPHVFEAFRQEDSSSTRAHGGLGLGLALVKHLVALHGGEVHAESAGKGKGATFTVLLPLIART